MENVFQIVEIPIIMMHKVKIAKNVISLVFSVPLPHNINVQNAKQWIICPV